MSEEQKEYAIEYIMQLQEENYKLQQENKQLKEKINDYENPDDMTLMFMWCDEKAKDKIKELQQKIDKAIEYINKHCVNEKISKEVGYKCYTMADTNELEHIMKLLGDKEIISSNKDN